MNELLAAQAHTSSNRSEIEASSVCGCANCMQIFPPTDIVAWTGLDMSDMDDLQTVNGETAVCPKCGSEAVIGDRSGFDINPHFLGRMQQAWFQKTTVIRRSKPKA